MKQIKNKLTSSKGESIAEVMVASLIAALALLLLATMIMSSTHLVQKSEKTMDDYYNQISNLDSGQANHSDSNVTIKRTYEDKVTHITVPDITVAVQKYSDSEYFAYSREVLVTPTP